ncbi:PAS domain S-box-containing protein [Sphingomonas jatrophae]|uniref:histidine kinase n=2 Tax=Sphingomonas jatrophae TaxID=1166337 RepID=A0A1I6K346_9SPHN|nr:PAS domain S-box-containing protein [Sphingomonas jatrophae]
MDTGYCLLEMIRDADGHPIDYRFVDLNPAFVRHTGLQDALGCRIRELRPDHEQHWFDIYDAVARTGEPVRFRNVAAALGRTFEVSAFRVGGEGSREVVALFSDVTAQEAAEANAQASERTLAAERNRLRTLVDHLPVGVSFIAPDGQTALSNPAFRTFFPGEVASNADLERTGAAHQAYPPAPVAQLAESALAGEPTLEQRICLHPPGGEPRWTRISGIPVEEDGHVAGAILTVLDVDEQVRASDALQRQAEGLESEVARRTADRDRIWRLARDLMLVARLDGTVNAINPAWSALLGWHEDRLIGTNLLDLVHPEDLDVTIREVQALGAGRSVLAFENRCRAADGSYRVLAWTAVPADGLIHAVARDVTDLRARALALHQAEEQLRQAQKMEAVGQLTGGVAHDFNNMLTIIRSSTDLLRRPDLPEARRRRYIDAIAETSDRAAKLTGQLLAFARRQALKPEVFDMGDRVAAMDDMLRSIVGPRVRIVTDLACGGCFVEADRSQFETALINMAANARDAMDGDGELHISVRALDHKPMIRGHASTGGRFVALSVTDSGSGIAPERIAQVFEPFFTTKEVGRGTGLGLSQVYGFAKQSGGDVDVASTPGQGACFTLYLPNVDAALVPARMAPRATATTPGGGRRVLVVEDNLDVGTFSTQILQDLGYETRWAANAKEALALLGGGLTVDAVFSDVVMPGMSGVELGEEIRRRWPDLPVILTSGYSHVLAEEGRHGFELLQKPYAIEELSRLLARMVPLEGQPDG